MRSFRVLRPLKSITNIPGLKKLVVALMYSVKQLRDSFIVLYFFYLIFAIAGLQLFSGVLKKKCVEIETGKINQLIDICGVRACPQGYVCGKTNQNPNFDQTSFDTIFYAFIAVFQQVTLEGWTYNMKFAQKAYARQAWFYFCPITFIISYFLVQLTQAVISNAFQTQHTDKDEAKKKIQKAGAMDFENLNEKERLKLIEQQESSRKEVLNKWQQLLKYLYIILNYRRMILYIKKKMRIVVKSFKEKKKQQLEARGILQATTNIGFKNYFTKRFPKPIEELIQSNANFDTKNDFSQIGSNPSGSQRKLINKQNQIISNTISNSDDELQIKKNRSKNRKIKESNKKQYGNIEQKINSRNDIQNISKDSSRKIQQNKGLLSLKHKINNSIDQDFFEQFISTQCNELMLQFQDNELRQMVKHLDGKQFLDNINEMPIMEDLEEINNNNFEDNQYELSFDSGQFDDKHYVHNDVLYNANDTSRIVSEDDQKGKDITQITSQKESRSKALLEDTYQITSIQKNNISNQDIHFKTKRDNSNQIILFNKKSFENEENKNIISDKININTEECLPETQYELKKSQTKLAQNMDIRKKYQNQKRKIQSQYNQKSKSQKTNIKKSDIRSSDVTSIISKSQIQYQLNGLSDMKKSKIKTKFVGPNTIVGRDFIDHQQSVFNNKSLVEKDVGKHKKIYIRNDKLNFDKQIDDIFEQRKRLKKDIAIQKAQQDSIDYLNNMKIKPYQRKILLTIRQVEATLEQKEVLNVLQLDSTDLEKEIQKQYDKAFISELYVTGTLSIVIHKKNKDNQQISLRKLKEQGVQHEENENLQIIQMVRQQLSFLTLSVGTKFLINLQAESSSMNKTSNILSSSAVSRQISRSTTGLKRSKTLITNKTFQFNQDANDGVENITQLKKDKYLTKQAAKDPIFQKKVLIKRINKDAMKSILFRQIVIKRKIFKAVPGDDVKDSEEEDEEEDDDNDIDDFYLDLQFDCQTEILRSKKRALQKKNSTYQWSGQDVLINYDPNEAVIAKLKIEDIRIWRYGVLGFYKKVIVFIKTFINSSFIDNFMTLSVAFNTILLALDKYDADIAISLFLEQANKTLTYIFCCEMGLKIIGIGIKRYLKDKMNYLDGGIVLLSMVELSLSSGAGAISAFRSIRIFRIFRVLRITRLLRAMKEMTSIINSLINSLNSLMYLYMLVFLSVFIFALLGMQIFGGNMNFEINSDGYSGIPRQNYSSFFWSFTVCFQLLTQENWQIVLFDTLRSGVNKGLTMIYHIAWMTVGNTILLNLLMGIMLDSMAQEEQEEGKKEKVKQKMIEEINLKEGEQLIEYFQTNEDKTDKQPIKSKKTKKKKKQDDNILDESFEFEAEIFQNHKKFNIMKKKKKDFEGNFCELSYYIFSKKNPFRLFLYKMVNHFMFEVIIQSLILLSSVKLILDGYAKNLDPESLLMKVMNNTDLFFTVSFAFESLCKQIAYGFMMDKGTYLRETWSQLDFFIVTTSVIDASFSSVNIPFIKILRLLRTLRPLRVISHNSEMKTIIVALIHSVSGIFYVGILLILVWIMFSILGVNLLGGKLQRCSVNPYDNFTPEQCSQAQGLWYTPYFNYDNVGISLISLFDVATMENWPDQRNNVMDMSGQGTGPIRNNSTIYSFFFMVFILIGAYIFLNLFIGVIFMKFGDAQKEEIKETNLNEAQLKWVDMVKMIVHAKPDLETTNIPNNKLRKKFHAFVTAEFYKYKPDENKKANKFEIFIMACIIGNMFTMCVVYEGSDPHLNKVLDYINYSFTTIFIVEAILKLIAFGHTYFQNSWNIFDFCIVFSSVIDISLNLLNTKTISFLRIGPQLARVLRVMRVSRLFRLIKKYKGLNALLQTIQFSLPALMNVFALLMLVYFIFSILATNMFSEVNSGLIIDDYTNFNTFGTAMLTLIRASTGEDWNYIMQDCSYTAANNCIPGQTCGSAYAVMFFICFETIQSFIMLNLFILVTIQQFEKYYLQEENVLQKFKDNLSLFKDMWTYYTIDNQCQKISGDKIVKFFYDIGYLRLCAKCRMYRETEKDKDKVIEREKKCKKCKQFRDIRMVQYFYDVSNNKTAKMEDVRKMLQKKQLEKEKERLMNAKLQQDIEVKIEEEIISPGLGNKKELGSKDNKKKGNDKNKKKDETKDQNGNQKDKLDKKDKKGVKDKQKQNSEQEIQDEKKGMDNDTHNLLTKEIVRMDLEADGEGYVYFNELLFKTMKMVFGEQHLKNKILVQAEYEALKNIQQAKEKMLRKQRANARIQAMMINPFLLKMYKHISFKTWLKQYKTNQNMRLKQKEEKGEAEISDAEADSLKKGSPDINVEYKYITEDDVSCSDSGDNQEIDNFDNNKSNSGSQSNEQSQPQSQIDDSQPYYDDEEGSDQNHSESALKDQQRNQ